MSHETDQCLDTVKINKKHIIPLFIRDVKDDVIEQRTVLNHIVRSHPRLDWRVMEDAMPRDLIATNSLEEGDNQGTAIEMNGDSNNTRGNASRSRQKRKLKRCHERVWKTIRLQMPPTPRHPTRSSDLLDVAGIADDPVSSESDRLVSNGGVV